MVTGALLLASIYHTVLYTHNPRQLIASYSRYLWSVFVYCLIKCIYFKRIPSVSFFVTDEALQMISFLFYVLFSRVAMELDVKKDRLAYLYCRIAPVVILIYIPLNGLLHHLVTIYHVGRSLFIATYIGIRILLLAGGFISLLTVVKRRKDTYFKYILYAISAMIFFGLCSTMVQLFWWNRMFPNALTVLAVGYNVDVYFFSASISYKMSMETIEKERANQRVLEQELELQKNKLEKIELSFKIREQERSRIASELHDEIGSTLSSVSILSEVITMEQNEENKTQMQDEIKGDVRVIMEKMDDIIWSLNPRNDSMEEMLLRIRQFATTLFEAKNINYIFDFSTEVFSGNLLTEKRQDVYLILKESVNNVVKHSGCTEARVSAKRNGDFLEFSVEDNGKGFETTAAFSGNGLYNIRQRAKNIAAQLVLKSVPGIETSLKLIIKIV